MSAGLYVIGLPRVGRMVGRIVETSGSKVRVQILGDRTPWPTWFERSALHPYSKETT